MQEVQNLRRDIAVLRQTYSAMASDFSGAMNDIKSKAVNIKTIAAEAAVPSYSGDSGRSHILTGKKALSTDSETLINRVDDLADIVDELRKDVVTRGVRPLPRQLEDIGKELSMTLKELSRIKEFVKREKPVWTKIWEGELQVVMSEREDLTQREEIIGDLDGDLEDLAGTFKLVEEVTKQQNLTGDGTKGRNASGRMIEIDAGVDPMEAKTGMLDEVRALSVNHENRLEAIERAEKARKRELMSRKGGEFQREVEQFVQDGRLRKTGGAEEVERVRRVRVEKARREHEEWLREREKQKYEDMKREFEGDDGAADGGAPDWGASGGSGTATSGYGFMAGTSGFDFDDDGDEDEDDFEIMPDGSVRTKAKVKPEDDGGGNINGDDGAPQLPEIDVGGKTSPESSRGDEGKGKETNSDGTSFYVGD
jgi:hypothetical protein